jgi:RimJ/RimL family protein N-acetyltransferase
MSRGLVTPESRIQLKQREPLSGEIRIAIPKALECPVEYLRPVACVQPYCWADAALVAKWRNANREAFFKWYTASPEQTEEWLRTCYVVDPNDLMFMICSRDGTTVGHAALYGFSPDSTCCEFGRVVLDNDSVGKGAMFSATRTLLDWSAINIGVTTFHLEVFKDNERGIRLYERAGFIKREQRRFIGTTIGGVTYWKYQGDEPEPPQAVVKDCFYMERTAE